MSEGIVKERHINKKGEVTGQFHVNLLLNNIIYDVEFVDGTIKEYTVNIIAQNIHAAMFHDGKYMQVIESISYHSFYTTKHNHRLGTCHIYL